MAISARFIFVGRSTLASHPRRSSSSADGRFSGFRSRHCRTNSCTHKGSRHQGITDEVGVNGGEHLTLSALGRSSVDGRGWGGAGNLERLGEISFEHRGFVAQDGLEDLKRLLALEGRPPLGKLHCLAQRAEVNGEFEAQERPIDGEQAFHVHGTCWMERGTVK